MCPKCGKQYGQNDNFCSKHDELVKLVNSHDLVKICPKCGRKYLEDDNYCSKHDNLVELVLIDSLSKICNNCGAKYPKEYDYCIQCSSKDKLVNIVNIEIKRINTNPNKYYDFNEYSNHLADFNDLLSASNLGRLNEFSLNQVDFEKIISKIKSTSHKVLNNLIDEHNIDYESLNALDKIFLLSKSFVKTFYKEGGGDLGHYAFNEIYIDDRATDALQITTIIHELSHFLLSEILEQVVCMLLNTNKTDALEAYISYILSQNKFNYLVDEYCAHTVEGRYAVLGYQDYGSYELALKEFLKEYDPDTIDVASIAGNTFATYIKDISSSFIDNDLRNDIKEEYLKINDVPKYSALRFETSKTFMWDDFLKVINVMLIGDVEKFKSNPHDIEKLKLYAVKFKKNNGE